MGKIRGQPGFVLGVFKLRKNISISTGQNLVATLGGIKRISKSADDLITTDGSWAACMA